MDSSFRDYGFITLSPPSEGSINLNMDGCSKGNLGPTWPKGGLRDSLGRWVIGFYPYLGECNSMIAELEAIWFGLELARCEGFINVIVR